MATATEREFLTKVDIARMLAVPERHVDRMVRKGLLPVARTYPGLHRRFRLADVLALRERFEAPAATA
jgi:excisionase family DNA binding protein